jgi:glucose-6-phosphate 1-epimerase
VLVPGKAIRGGIPLCFPWFGPHPDDPGKPAHGFARLRDWELVQAAMAGDSLLLAFRLQSDAATRALWPHDFNATLVMTLGRTLALQLQVDNTGTQDFRFGFALHSYFPVSDVRTARIEGLEGVLYINQLHPERARLLQEGPVRFAGETDRIYLHTPSRYQLLDPGRGQAIRISAADCRSVVIWNPWEAKTARLPDMAPSAWQGMVCVESGNVEDDQVLLPAGAGKAFTLLLESEA